MDGVDFTSCRKGRVVDAVVVFRSDGWAVGGVNVGPGTAPKTFAFARDARYCTDRPAKSTPRLPAAEAGGLVGRDPLPADPGKRDFTPRPGRPAAGRGHTGLKASP